MVALRSWLYGNSPTSVTCLHELSLFPRIQSLFGAPRLDRRTAAQGGLAAKRISAAGPPAHIAAGTRLCAVRQVGVAGRAPRAAAAAGVVRGAKIILAARPSVVVGCCSDVALRAAGTARTRSTRAVRRLLCLRKPPILPFGSCAGTHGVLPGTHRYSPACRLPVRAVGHVGRRAGARCGRVADVRLHRRPGSAAMLATLGASGSASGLSGRELSGSGPSGIMLPSGQRRTAPPAAHRRCGILAQ